MNRGGRFQGFCPEVAVRERNDVTMDEREIIREMYRRQAMNDREIDLFYETLCISRMR